MSTREIEQQLAPLFEVIATTKPDWDVRINAMNQIQSIITNPQYANADWNTILQQRYLICFSDQLRDNRTGITKKTVELIESISCLGNSISERASFLALTCLERVTSGNSTIMQRCQSCTYTLFRNVVMKKALSTLQRNISSANENVRITCYECLKIVVETWPLDIYNMNEDVISMISSGFSAASLVIREKSREIFTMIKSVSPDMATKIYSRLDPQSQTNLDRLLQNRSTSVASMNDTSMHGSKLLSPNKFSQNSFVSPKGSFTPRNQSQPRSYVNNTISQDLETTQLSNTISKPNESMNITNSTINVDSPMNRQNNFGLTATAPASTRPQTIINVENTDYKYFDKYETLSLGCRVKFIYKTLQETGYGTVRYIGYIPKHQNIFCGIELDKPHAYGGNGVIDFVRFFTTTPKRAVFFKATTVTRIDDNSSLTSSVETQNTLLNNEEFAKLTTDHRIVIKDTLDDMVVYLNTLNDVLPDSQNIQKQKDYISNTKYSLQRLIEEYQTLLQQFSKYNV